MLVEAINTKYLARNKLDPKGALFKATKDHACLSLGENVDSLWERKDKFKGDKLEKFAPIRSLIEQINFCPDKDYHAISQKIFDYDNYINSLALNMLIGNRSTYYHNYYIYQDPQTHKWSYLPWDMDQTFVWESVEDHYGRGNLSDKWHAKMASNPYFERGLNDATVFADIQKRINELSQKYFNPKYLFPIIDSLEKELRPYMELDHINPKVDPSNYTDMISNLKQFITLRNTILADQFAHSPYNFQLDQPKQIFTDQITLSWKPSIDPDGDRVKYQLSFSLNPSFPENETYYFENIETTKFHVPIVPAVGKYYWRVFASDGKYDVRGFDNICTFEVANP